jgi:hypothetical protein
MAPGSRSDLLVVTHNTPEQQACCQCHRFVVKGYAVSWICEACQKNVCCECCLGKVTSMGKMELFNATLCSEDCRIVANVQRRLRGEPSVEDEEG